MSKENPTVSKMETTTLTEQWKNGTIKEGWYYLSIVPNKKCIDYFIGQDFERYNEWAIEEVLAPVPSYEEWEELQESNDGLSKLMFKLLMNKFVKADEERERLEEENIELVTKCHRLEKQLDIATKALEEIERKSDKFDNSLGFIEQLDYIKADCQATLHYLKEIDEVKNDLGRTL